MNPQINFIECINANAEKYRMYYSAWGNHETATRHMLCIHGLNRNSRDWDYVGEYFSKLGYYVVCPDIVGRGLSDNLVNFVGYNIPFYVSDILNLINTLGLSKIDFIGTSMGGIIGMYIATMPQNKFKRLVLNDIGAEIDANGLLRIMSYSKDQLYFDSFSQAKSNMIELSKEFGVLPEDIWHDMALNSYQKNSSGKYELKRDPNIAKTFALLASGVDLFASSLNSVGVNFTQNSKMQNINLWDTWNKITDIPTLIIRGVNSDILSQEVLYKMINSRHSVSCIEIKDAGHAPFLYSLDHMQMLNKFFI